MAMKSRTKPKTIDEYLAALRDDQRAALQKLRKTIQSAAPKAEETRVSCVRAHHPWTGCWLAKNGAESTTALRALAAKCVN